MSFQEERSDVSICNKALSRIKQQGLAGALDDPANLNKHVGRECKLWYKTIVRQVITSHHWGLATKRVALASQATNDLSNEWTNAYIAPTDMAFPVYAGPFALSATVSYYRGVGFLLAQLMGRPLFRYEGNTIYSNTDGALLEYVSFNITEQQFSDAVEKLIVLFLASVLARSVAKDDKLADDLHTEAIKEMNVEIARNLNIGRPKYHEGFSDTEMVRGGYDPVLAGYRLFP